VREDPWSSHSSSRHYTDAPMIKDPQASGSENIYMKTTLGPGVIAFANDIRVRYRREDFETASSTPPPSASAPTSAASVRSSGADTTQTDGCSAGGGRAGRGARRWEEVEWGAYAGIEVPVAVVLVALLAGFLVFLRRKVNAKTRLLSRDSPGPVVELRSEARHGQVLEMENAGVPRDVNGDRELREVEDAGYAPGELDRRGRGGKLVRGWLRLVRVY
jgi:hypothetical protein